MKIGVTGSRNGATPRQISRLAIVLKNYIYNNIGPYYRPQAEPIELHHGCCYGVDEITAYLAHMMGYQVFGHPPTNPSYVSTLAINSSHTMYPAKEYLDRNKDIVEITDVLIVVPDGPEHLRSGTWSTKRYADRLGKLHILIPAIEPLKKDS